MTISTTNNRKVYSANGATTVFAYDFLVLDQTHLEVYLLEAGSLVLKALTTDYTVSGVNNPSGGNITFNVAPAAGTANVVIQRVVPATQLVDYVSNDAFPADTHERALDKITMVLQQLLDSSERSFTLAINDTSGASLELPAPSALKFLRWNSAALALEYVDVASAGAVTLPVAVAQGGTGATTAAAALDELGASGRGKQTIFIPAAAMVSRTTNGAAAGTVETTTNKVMAKTLDFDTTTAEYAQFQIQMPKSWDEGTVTFAAVWSHAATTTNFGVAWSLQAVALSNDDALDTAFGTKQTVTDTGGTTNDVYVTAESSAITIAGTPASQDYVIFQVERTVADAGDTMAIDARLHGLQVYFSTNAANDA